MSEFDGVHPALAGALQERGYDTLTPVQKAVLAPELEGRDVLVSAQTGSGKTVAFGLALAPGLLNAAGRFDYAAAPLALIIAPTRELALQVRREIEWLYAGAGAVVASCVGGMDYRTERRTLERGAHIVIGTPGRLRDHIDRGGLDMTGLRAAVLDEADEMLDLGFREDLEYILGAAPEDRRTLMFSATVSKPIATLAQSYQRDAVRVKVEAETRQHVDIDYRVITVADGDRDHAILNLLRYHEAPTALVFCATRAGVTHLTARLGNRGFSVVALSGELSQTERSHALQAMRDGRARVCIATDVAARGIDLPGLELVIHADLPTNKEALLHRSGRTGRAGRKGISALVVTNRDARKAERLLGFAGVGATWEAAPGAEEIVRRDDERLLSDPAFDQPLVDSEAAMVRALLERHGPEQVAAALLRQARAGRSAPEELTEADSPRPREQFADAVWFEVSAGRVQNAEARWLLPMICRAGDITRRDIGAIRIQSDVTYVQIRADAADAFDQRLGDSGALEQGITAKRLDVVPEAVAGSLERQETRPDRGRDTGARKPGGPRRFGRSNDRDEDEAPRSRPAPRTTAPRAPYVVPSTPAPGAEPAPSGPGLTATRYPTPAKRAEPAARFDPADDRPRGKPHRKGPAPDRAEYAPKEPRERTEAAPAGKTFPKATGKPGGKPFGKPKFGDRDGAAGGGKPFSKGPGKGPGKPFGKPGGKPGGGKPAGKGGSTTPRRKPGA